MGGGGGVKSGATQDLSRSMLDFFKLQPVARQKLHEMSYSDPYQEPSEGTPHYEVYDDYAAPYWEPANMEDELKLQLARLQVLEIPTEDLK